MAAAVHGGAGGRSGESRLEEAALLPGAAVLVGLGGHARHLRRYRGDEPTAGGDAAQVVAKVDVLPGAARPVLREADGGVRGHQW